METVASFCPRCGTAMPSPNEGAHPTCPSCDYVAYADPKVATGVIVSRPASDPPADAPETPAKALLVRRNHEPALGKWAFPSGFVDAGEVVEDAARREVLEETGVHVAIDGLIGVYSEPGNPVVFIAYAGHVERGEATAGDEAFEVGWFDVDALPELAFPHDQQIIEDWRRLIAASL
jgi:ADP-ribose pyrophosphatase YjhB (NUDIX family)